MLLGSRLRWGTPSTNSESVLEHALQRLARPLREALAAVEGSANAKDRAVATLLRSCGREQSAFWGWNDATWVRVLGVSPTAFVAVQGQRGDGRERQLVMAVAYRLGCWTDIRAIGDFQRQALTEKVFGREAVAASVHAIQAVEMSWGYAASGQEAAVATLCEAFLLNRSPSLQDLSAERLEGFRRAASGGRRGRYFQLAKALVGVGILSAPLPLKEAPAKVSTDVQAIDNDIDAEWSRWVTRWEATSALSPATRKYVRLGLIQAGRWLRKRHSEVTSPHQWTRQVGADYVAAVVRMKVGDYAHPGAVGGCRHGQPLSASSKNQHVKVLRVFFRDCQEWGWITPHFAPERVLATPRSVTALIGPAPRTIAADVWAKLMWAGLHLTNEDLPSSSPHTHHSYPLELVQALSVVWLFAGLRSDEIVRLRVGCVRWQSDDVFLPASHEVLPKGVVCLLDVPVHKTGTAFTKPVDPVVGEAIAAWERVRPRQPAMTDQKTAEVVDFLFCYRAGAVPKNYLNRALIPRLCKKAGVPLRDVRGTITSHRARATIASQLFNAREPMTLFELQAWLGHRSPTSTQHYVAITPTKLAKAYADAGYFARNTRAVEVLIDQDSIRTGAAAAGAPWRYYDLGHGLCTYEFFDQCPHRMACARCDFYVPKASSLCQLIEAKDSLLRLQREIALTEEECAAADGDLKIVDQLMAKLRDQPTPSGQTPLQLARCGTEQMIPTPHKEQDEEV